MADLVNSLGQLTGILDLPVTDEIVRRGNRSYCGCGNRTGGAMELTEIKLRMSPFERGHVMLCLFFGYLQAAFS